MADENIIKNVGGFDGIASEATMQKLLAAMEKMAKASGKDPSSQERRLRETANKSLMGNIQAVKGTTAVFGSLMKNATPLGMAFTALSKVGGVAGTAMGSLAKNAVGFGQELLGTSTRLSDFSRHIPIVGNAMSSLVGIIDETYDSFTQLSKSGVDFNYNMAQFRNSARDAGLSLSEYTNFVRENTERMASFGGTVTSGAMGISRLTSSMDRDLRENLLSMGLTFEDINDQLISYAYLNRAGARTRIQDENSQAAAMASYTKNLLTLSKLTGKDINQVQEKMAQEQMDMAFQMELNKLDEEERKKVNAAMAEAMASGGDVAVNALKAQFLGMPPLTRELQLYTATQGESARLIADLLNRALDRSITAEQFQEGQADRMADYLGSQIRSADHLNAILRAGAAGAEGLPSELANMMNANVDILAKYFNNVGGSLVFARDEFLADMEAAKKLQPTDDELKNMATFQSSLRDIRASLTKFLINPLITVVNPVLEVMADTMKAVGDESSIFSELLEYFSPYISKFGESIKTSLENLKKGNFSQAFMDVFSGLGAVIGGIWESPAGMYIRNGIKDAFTFMIDTLMDSIWNYFFGSKEKPETDPTVLNASRAGLLPSQYIAEVDRLKGNLDFYSNIQTLTPEMLEDMQRIVNRLTELGVNVEGHSKGTNGFEDFGKGTLAVLHGKEAVIPKDSAMGKFIQRASEDAPRRPTFSDALKPRNPPPVASSADIVEEIAEEVSKRSLLGMLTRFLGGPIGLGLAASLYPSQMGVGTLPSRDFDAMLNSPNGLTNPNSVNSNIRGIGADGLSTPQMSQLITPILDRAITGQVDAMTRLPSAPVRLTLPFNDSDIRAPGIDGFNIPSVSRISGIDMQDLLPEISNTATGRNTPTAEIVDSIGNMNQTNTKNTNNMIELQKKLNMLMNDVRNVLFEMRDINKKIETNTRSLGTNVSSGKITNIR